MKGTEVVLNIAGNGLSTVYPAITIMYLVYTTVQQNTDPIVTLFSVLSIIAALFIGLIILTLKKVGS